MVFEDPTVKQHFISQVEQRLNAVNPNANEDNQKIQRFRLSDREVGTLCPPSTVKIAGNLMLPDLFSFDRAKGSSLRSNFERLFHGYERNIRLNTDALLRKVSCGNDGVGSEIVELFRSKLLNFFRTPFSVKKVLNSLPSLMGNLYPTDQAHLNDYLRVLEGSKPQMQYVCQALDISEEEYEQWLRSLFLMLNPMIVGQRSFFDQMVKALCGDRETYLIVWVFTYANEACLLSDRGFVIPFEQKDHEGWAFNLSANAFAIYSFTNVESFYRNFPGPKPPISARGMSAAKDSWKSVVHVRHIAENLDALKAYNESAVFQCHEHVYSSREMCHGVRILKSSPH